MKLDRYVTLALYSEDLSSIELGQIIGIAADNFYDKGDSIDYSSTKIRKYSSWELNSGNHVKQDDDIYSHIDYITTMIKQIPLENVPALSELQPEIKIVQYENDVYIGVNLTSELIQLFGQINASVDVNSYSLSA